VTPADRLNAAICDGTPPELREAQRSLVEDLLARRYRPTVCWRCAHNTDIDGYCASCGALTSTFNSGRDADPSVGSRVPAAGRQGSE
jgi:hypothetical protein